MAERLLVQVTSGRLLVSITVETAYGIAILAHSNNGTLGVREVFKGTSYVQASINNKGPVSLGTTSIQNIAVKLTLLADMEP